MQVFQAKMKNTYRFLLILMSVFYLVSATGADQGAVKGIKLGFGYDRDFGITGSAGKFNGFLGNDGVALDYIFFRQRLDNQNPLYWYVGGGGFVDWDGDFGMRLPVGGEYDFGNNIDAYVQLIPRLRVNNHRKNDKSFAYFIQ